MSAISYCSTLPCQNVLLDIHWVVFLNLIYLSIHLFIFTCVTILKDGHSVFSNRSHGPWVSDMLLHAGNTQILGTLYQSGQKDRQYQLEQDINSQCHQIPTWS